MDLSVSRVLGELSRRFGPPDLDTPSPEEVKLATRILVFIHAWIDGEVDEDEKISIDGSNSSSTSPAGSEDEYVEDQEDDANPAAPVQCTATDEEKMRNGWVKFSSRLVSGMEVSI